MLKPLDWGQNVTVLLLLVCGAALGLLRLQQVFVYGVVLRYLDQVVPIVIGHDLPDAQILLQFLPAEVRGVAPPRVDPVRRFLPDQGDSVLIDIAFDLHVGAEFIRCAKGSAGQVPEGERVGCGIGGRVRVYSQ